MKKFLLGIAIIMSCYAATAQGLMVNNNVGGDVYIKVYPAKPNTCTPITSGYVDIMIPATTTGVMVDLTDPANWNGTIPTAFDLMYAEVSRDPACPGSAGWGVPSGSCAYGTSYFDQVTVGNGGCGYSAQDCFEVSISGSSCGGFAAGDVAGVIYTPSGTFVTIDIK